MTNEEREGLAEHYAASEAGRERNQRDADLTSQRMDRIERAVFGYRDEGGVFVVGILGSMKDMNSALYGAWDEKHQVRQPGILELVMKNEKFLLSLNKATGKVFYALVSIIAIGLFNAFHLAGDIMPVIGHMFGH
jgi:hypothetical protein